MQLKTTGSKLHFDEWVAGFERNPAATSGFI